MVDPIQELKIRAEILHSGVSAGKESAQKRLRALPELAKADAAGLAAAGEWVRRKHCLAVVAREHGFSSWEQARRVLEGDARELDLGTLLYGPEAAGTLNVWFADYEEARAHFAESRRRGEGHALLAYRRQFLIVDRHFIAAIRLDPEDPDWEAIGWDWPRPRDPKARQRLYGKRIAALREAA